MCARTVNAKKLGNFAQHLLEWDCSNKRENFDIEVWEVDNFIFLYPVEWRMFLSAPVLVGSLFMFIFYAEIIFISQ